MKRLLILIFLIQPVITFAQNDKKKEKELQGSYILGALIPRGDLDVIGTHPMFSVSVGKMTNQKYYLDFIGEFRILKSQNDYDFRYKGADMKGSKYFSMYLGGEFGYRIIDKIKNNFELFAGLGYDRFDFKKATGNIFIRDLNLYGAAHSPCLNAGFTFNHLLNRKSSLGFTARYNIVDYTIGNKTKLKGNTIEIGVKYKLFGEHFEK